MANITINDASLAALGAAPAADDKIPLWDTSAGLMKHLVPANLAAYVFAQMQLTIVSGKWGINTATPTDQLEIKDGKIALVSTVTTLAEFEGIYFWNGRDNTRYAAIIPTSGTFADAVGLRIYTSPSDVIGQRLSIDLAATGDCYFVGEVSALSYVDRTSYPDSLEVAEAAILSQRKDESRHPVAGKGQLDHGALHEFVRSGDNRDLSATVSALVEIVKEHILKGKN